jgi:hypothetical protein
MLAARLASTVRSGRVCRIRVCGLLCLLIGVYILVSLFAKVWSVPQGPTQSSRVVCDVIFFRALLLMNIFCYLVTRLYLILSRDLIQRQGRDLFWCARTVYATPYCSGLLNGLHIQSSGNELLQVRPISDPLCSRSAWAILLWRACRTE